MRKAMLLAGLLVMAACGDNPLAPDPEPEPDPQTDIRLSAVRQEVETDTTRVAIMTIDNLGPSGHAMIRIYAEPALGTTPVLVRESEAWIAPGGMKAQRQAYLVKTYGRQVVRVEAWGRTEGETDFRLTHAVAVEPVP